MAGLTAGRAVKISLLILNSVGQTQELEFDGAGGNLAEKTLGERQKVHVCALRGMEAFRAKIRHCRGALQVVSR